MIKLTKSGKMRMMTMSGKTNKITFEELFNSQLENQNILIEKGSYKGFASKTVELVPVDDPCLCSYHIQQLISEIGEVLEADKRWKNFRNSRFDKEAKLDEIADCFIVMMNVSMYSDFSGEEIAEAIKRKIDIVRERFSGIRE